MATGRRLMVGSAVGVFGGWFGHTGFWVFFRSYTLTPAVVTLLVLILSVGGFGVSRDWDGKSIASVTAVSSGAFVLTYFVWVVWAGMQGFPG